MKQDWAAAASLLAKPRSSSAFFLQQTSKTSIGLVGDVVPQQVQGLTLNLLKIRPQAQRTTGGLSHFHFVSSAKGRDDSLRC